MTIGELARSTGVHVETVRYYERCGLVPQPARRPSGYRVYSADSVARIRFIKNAQELGFSLAEIKKLLELRIDANTNCGEVRRQAQIKLSEINDKIRALQQMQQALLQLVAACEQGGPQGECPILDALAAQEYHPTAARVTSREAR